MPRASPSSVLENGAAHLQLTPGGVQALRVFARGAPLPAGPTPSSSAFCDGEGLERAFASSSNPIILQRFVEFCAVPAGGVVIEVGAGTGRLTFEGGLADAVRGGLLLATDPSAPMLRILERKRDEHAANHVHILVAPAEHLPVASGGAAAVLGSKFLQYADATVAIEEMMRAAAPGGIIAVLDSSGVELSPAWQRIVQPLVTAARSAERACRSNLHAPGEVAALFRRAGLQDVGVGQLEDRVFTPNYATTARGLTQVSFLEGFVADLPLAEQNTLVSRAYRDLEAVFAETGPQDRFMTAQYQMVRGRLPG